MAPPSNTPTSVPYTLYDESAGPSVVVEQAPCSKMTACVYRVILTYSADILVFDLTSPNIGIKVVNNGAEIFVHSETALANGPALQQADVNPVHCAVLQRRLQA